MAVEKKLWEFVGPACKTPRCRMYMCSDRLISITPDREARGEPYSPAPNRTEDSDSSLSSSIVSTGEHVVAAREVASSYPTPPVQLPAQISAVKGLTF